jgi:hypothetical protein
MANNLAAAGGDRLTWVNLDMDARAAYRAAETARGKHKMTLTAEQHARYDALMEVVRSRMTVRAFDPSHAVPREHYDMILEAARHSPSGANAQPWHFIVVTERAWERIGVLPRAGGARS